MKLRLALMTLAAAAVAIAVFLYPRGEAPAEFPDTPGAPDTRSDVELAAPVAQVAAGAPETSGALDTSGTRGTPTAPIDAGVESASEEPAATGALKGTVVDINLDPLADFQMQVIHHQVLTDLGLGMTVAESLQKHKAKGIWVTQATTDAAGHFSVKSLAPGTFHLRSKEGGVAPVADPEFPSDEGEPVMVQFRVTQLSIHVAEASGKHVHDAHVGVEVQEWQQESGWVTTQEYELTAAPGTGLYERRILGGERLVLEASREGLGYMRQVLDVETAASGPVQMRLE